MDSVPRGVLSLMPSLPMGATQRLRETSTRQSFPGVQGLSKAAEETDKMEAKFLPSLPAPPSSSHRNRGTSMPGYGGIPAPTKHQQHLGGILEAPRRSEHSPVPRNSGIFAGHKVLAPEMSKGSASVFPDQISEFRSAWSITVDKGNVSDAPPWVQEIFGRLDKLEGSTGAPRGDIASRLQALEDGFNQMQQTQIRLQQHDKTLIKKLQVLSEQLTTMEGKLTAAEEKLHTSAPITPAAAAEPKATETGKSEGVGNTEAGKGEAYKADTRKSEALQLKTLSADLSQHSKQLEDHEKLLHDMSVKLAEVHSSPATATEIASKANATATAAAATGVKVAPEEVQQAVNSVVGPLMQDSASQLAALTLKVKDGEQLAEQNSALVKELQGAIVKLHQQVGPKVSEGGGNDEDSTVNKRLEQMDLQVDFIKDQNQRLTNRVKDLELEVQQRGPPKADSVLSTIAESSDSYEAPAKPAASTSSSDGEAYKTAQQAMATSSKALTEASKAQGQASHATREVTEIKETLRAFVEQMAKVGSSSTDAAMHGAAALEKASILEQVAKTLAVKVDHLGNEVVALKAYKDSTPALASMLAAQSAAAAPLPANGAASGSDPKVAAILVDLQQLASGLGELAGRISVTEREWAMTLPTLSRVETVKQMESNLLDKVHQISQDMETMKRGIQAFQVQAWQQALAASHVGSAGMACPNSANPMSYSHGLTAGGMGTTGRVMAKSGSVVMKRMESRRPSNNPGAIKL